MRVISGTLSGRKFDGPDGFSTRPTTDRVREAVFNALGSMNIVRGAVVADLFAGSGGLGIEALSRGAAHCTFVEKDRAVLAVLKANLDSLGLDSVSTVKAGDALRLVAQLDVDIVLADPPYDFDDWEALLASTTATLVVAESARPVEAIDGWEVTRTKRYGRSWVTFLSHSSPTPGDD